MSDRHKRAVRRANQRAAHRLAAEAIESLVRHAALDPAVSKELRKLARVHNERGLRKDASCA